MYTFGDVLNTLKTGVFAYIYLFFAGLVTIISVFTLQLLAVVLMLPLIAALIYCAAHILMGIMWVLESF